MSAPLTKFAPFTVSVNPAPPAVTAGGVSDAIAGCGLSTVNTPAGTSGQPVLLKVMGPVTAPLGTVAVICVSLFRLKLADALLANFTAERPVKFAPVMVTVVPARALAGLRLLTVGQATAGLIVKLSALDEPPPGAGLKTVTAAVPPLATSLAEIAACNCVLLVKAVGRLLLFQRTTDPGVKFVPVSVKVKAGPPAVSEFWLSAVRVGAGELSTVNADVCTSAQLGLLNVRGPVTAPGGTMAVIRVVSLSTKLAGTLLANLTALTSVKFVPVITT